MKNAALAGLLGAGMVASAASAEIVHFVNPAPGQAGHYPWGQNQSTGAQTWLDITRPSSQQLDVQSGNAVGQVYEQILMASYVWHMSLGPAPISSLLRSSDSGWGAEPLPAGADIGPSDWWHNYTLLIEILYWPDYEVNSLFPEGERRYLGVRTDEGRYGWIEVERHGERLTAFSWAYESTPGVPIVAGAIPAPGAAALLALSSLASIRRRR